MIAIGKRIVKYILLQGKQPKRVIARSILSYWAVRELGISGTKVGKKLGLSQSAVSRPIQRDAHDFMGPYSGTPM
ncbi:MAG: LysR family transcriptional regulator, partial [Gammaproteobacteria bacterium]|nr:LysR family transcriptional regulator [Gammaproteobacteria bacterium]